MRFQTPSSVSFSGLTEFRGGTSVFLSAYDLCAEANSPSFFVELTEFAPKTQWGSVSSLLRNSTLETVFRPFPKDLDVSRQKLSPHCLETIVDSQFPENLFGLFLTSKGHFNFFGLFEITSENAL